ncbi:partial plastocyanin, partial [Anaerolineae bacterium]
TTPSVVIMQNIMFLPNPVTIPRGTAVQWKNQDATAHTVTSGTPGNISGLFRSGNLTTGQTFSFTFTTAGTFPYFCEIHGAQMTGPIIVQ